jgi:hypothetical protein
MSPPRDGIIKDAKFSGNTEPSIIAAPTLSDYLNPANAHLLRSTEQAASPTDKLGSLTLFEKKEATPIELCRADSKTVDPKLWKFALKEKAADTLEPQAVNGKPENGYVFHPANPPGLDAQPGTSYDLYHDNEHRNFNIAEAGRVDYEGNIFQGTYGQAGAKEIEFKFKASEYADKDGRLRERVVEYSSKDGSAKGPDLKLAGASDDIGKNVHTISWYQDEGGKTSSVEIERYPEPFPDSTAGETRTWVAKAEVNEDGTLGAYKWQSLKKSADGRLLARTGYDSNTFNVLSEETFDAKGEKVIKVVRNSYLEGGGRIEWETDETGRMIRMTDFLNNVMTRNRLYQKENSSKDEVTLVTENYNTRGKLRDVTTFWPATQKEAEIQHKINSDGTRGSVLKVKEQKQIAYSKFDPEKVQGHTISHRNQDGKVIPPIEYYDNNDNRIEDKKVQKLIEEAIKTQRLQR